MCALNGKHKIVKSSEAILVLKAYYGMTGSPKIDFQPKKESFEYAFTIAAGTTDPTYFEVLVPTLAINDWKVSKFKETIADLTPQGEYVKARIHLAVIVMLGILSYSKLGIPNGNELQEKLFALEELVASAVMTKDPFFTSNTLPENTGSPYLKQLGINIIWPLADFHKQLDWTIQKHYNNI